MKEKSVLAKSAIFIMILLFCSKILGFFREILLAYKFGTSYVVDAYTISIALPSVVFTIFASGFSQSYVPVFARIVDSKEKKMFFSNVLTILLIMSFIICAFCFAFSENIVTIMAPGFDSKTRDLTIKFVKIIAFVFPSMTTFNLISAHLSSKEDFVMSNFCDSIVVNIVIICSILFVNIHNLFILPIGYALSMCLSTMLLIFYSIKTKKLLYKPYIKFKNYSWKLLCSMAIPLGLSLLVNQLNTVIDRIFSSTLGEGITSSLNYADKVQSIFLTLTTSIFLTVCYPRINKYFANDNKKEGIYYIKKAISIAIYTSAILVAILIFYSEPVIKILFENGKFNANSTIMTASCLMCYSLGIPFYALREILTKTLAANKKQNLILKNTIISVVCNVLLNYLFINNLGYKGLALATSISGLISFLLLKVDIKSINIEIVDKEMKTDFIKIVVCLIISVMIGKIFIKTLTILFESDLVFIVGIIITGIIYFFITLFTKVKIIYWLLNKIKAV